MVTSSTVLAAPRPRGTGRIPALCMMLGVALAAAGCTLQSSFSRSGELGYDPSLLTGERIFGEPASLDEVPRVPINQPSPEMREYVARNVSETALSSVRFQELYDSLTEDGYFDAVYSANRTLTAAETFDARGGNCLSYTNMFLALARLADLDAHYQLVDVPASWDADAGFLIRYTHINVLLKNVQPYHRPRQELIIDFNFVQPDPDYLRRTVSDDYAESLFYANKSVKLMRQNQPRKAFAHLRRAIDVAPHNADLWINLGAFYATQEDFDSSIEAYEVALQLEPRSKAAFSGLARSYANAGNQEMAAVYEEKVRHYRQRNPYYHYALAQRAFESADYEGSLHFINEAIELKRRTARFHLLKGLVLYQLGDADAGRESFERAQRYGLHPSVKLDLLRSLAGVGAS